MLTSAEGDAARAASPEAGWHADPLGRRAYRYWDGERWSVHVSDDGFGLAVDAHESIGGAPQLAPARRRGLAALTTVVAVALVAGGVFWQAGSGGSAAGGPMSWEGVDGRGGDREPAVAPSDPRGGEAGEREGGDEGVAPPDTPGRWPEALGPTTVVYRHERSDGEAWEVLVASDPPRSTVRSPDSMTLIVAGQPPVICDARTCAEDVAPASVDLLTNYVTFGSPWPDAESSAREIAGREASCATDELTGDTLCWDRQTGLMLLNDPGGAGLRITAVELRAPESGDFELPHELSAEGIGALE